MIPAVDAASPRDWAMEHIYRLIQASTFMTRPALASRTGLPASTVSHAVTRLLETGRIVEGERPLKGPGSGSGRPPRVLRLPTDLTLGAAVSFGPTQLRLAIGDAHGTVLAISAIPCEPGGTRDAADLACDGLEALCRERGIDELAGVVAGLSPTPAPTPRDAPRPASVPPPPDVGARLAERLGSPVEVDTRLNLATYGELHLGAGRRHENFILWQPAEPGEVGIALNGRVYRGAAGFAGRLPEAGGSADSLATVCNLLNPTAVVIADGRWEALPAVVSAVRRAIDACARPSIAANVEVVGAELGAEAELRGSLLRAGRAQPRGGAAIRGLPSG